MKELVTKHIHRFKDRLSPSKKFVLFASMKVPIKIDDKCFLLSLRLEGEETLKHRCVCGLLFGKV